MTARSGDRSTHDESDNTDKFDIDQFRLKPPSIIELFTSNTTQWLSIIGFALTLLSAIEPLIQLAHWVRTMIIWWKEFTYFIWSNVNLFLDYFRIEIDEKNILIS